MALLGDGAAVAGVLQGFFNGEKPKSKSLDPRKAVSCSSVWNQLKLYFFGPFDLITAANSGKKI